MSDAEEIKAFLNCYGIEWTQAEPVEDAWLRLRDPKQMELVFNSRSRQIEEELKEPDLKLADLLDRNPDIAKGKMLSIEEFQARLSDWKRECSKKIAEMKAVHEELKRATTEKGKREILEEHGLIEMGERLEDLLHA